jgi:Cysteine-rich CWC
MAGHHDNAATRRLNCGRCGTHFNCSLAGNCWCASEPYRLRLPDSAVEDCLCPTCLRDKAASQHHQG